VNKQEKFTSENVAFLEKTIKDGTLGMKIITPILTAFTALQFYMDILPFPFVVLNSVIFSVVAYFITIKNQDKIRQDIKNGFKNIINGTITRKRVGKGGYYALYVNDVRYRTNHEQYNAFDMRDSVQIEATPIRKKLLKIVKI
jgi:hypothetical protein